MKSELIYPHSVIRVCRGKMRVDFKFCNIVIIYVRYMGISTSICRKFCRLDNSEGERKKVFYQALESALHNLKFIVMLFNIEGRLNIINRR